MGELWQKYSSEIIVLLLTAMVLCTLLLIVPQLLRHHQRTSEMRHLEHIKAIEKGLPVPPVDDRIRAAGRTASLVPMVVVCAAGTVTCFLVAYRSENTFAISLSVWVVAGVVCLAAITAGSALMGRLSNLEEEDDDGHSPA
jgi:hypothetical protein